MFGFSMGEMILIMAIALIAIGPKQLPEVARTLGKLMNELRRASSDFTRSFTDVRDETRNSFNDVHKSMSDAFTAGSNAYNDVVRAAPEGTLSSTTTKAPAPGTPGTHPITADDPFGVGHNAHAHPLAHEIDPQGSLFVPTDLSGVQPEKAVDADQQLEFRLTSFDDDSHEGKS